MRRHPHFPVYLVLRWEYTFSISLLIVQERLSFNQVLYKGHFLVNSYLATHDSALLSIFQYDPRKNANLWWERRARRLAVKEYLVCPPPVKRANRHDNEDVVTAGRWLFRPMKWRLASYPVWKLKSCSLRRLSPLIFVNYISTFVFLDIQCIPDIMI